MIVTKKVNEYIYNILNVTFSRISVTTSYSKLSQRGSRMRKGDCVLPCLLYTTRIKSYLKIKVRNK